MSNVHSEATSEPLANLLLDFPGADIILRSKDSYHLRVPNVFLIHNSLVLKELVRKALASSGVNAEASLPVVQLPESGKMLRYLLTFILPLFPDVPPNHEEAMELLSVAQTYQMETVLVRIRAIITRQSPLPTHLEPALRIYALAQKYGLRPEAIRSARSISKYPMTIEDLEDKLDIMPGASLHELWKYYERVRTTLASDLTEFKSGACNLLTGFCTELTTSQIPSWVDEYIVSMGNAPHLFDLLEFNIAMTRHIKNVGDRICGECGYHAGCRCASKRSCKCGFISGQTIHEFWEALVSVVNGCFEKVSVIICELLKIEPSTG